MGPAASIVLAEVVLSDIDRKILSHTSSFVRWVDDFRIFFRAIDEARVFLHEFTKYLYEVHRLVLSGEKTRLLRVSVFTSPCFAMTKHLKRQAKTEEVALEEYLEELYKRVGPYTSPEDVFDDDEYAELQKQLKNAARYRIRAILKTTFEHLELLLPIVREVSIYARAVLRDCHKKSVSIFLQNRYSGANG